MITLTVVLSFKLLTTALFNFFTITNFDRNLAILRALELVCYKLNYQQTTQRRDFFFPFSLISCIVSEKFKTVSTSVLIFSLRTVGISVQGCACLLFRTKSRSISCHFIFSVSLLTPFNHPVSPSPYLTKKTVHPTTCLPACHPACLRAILPGCLPT